MTRARARTIVKRAASEVPKHCYHYVTQEGRCDFGDKCRYRHDPNAVKSETRGDVPPELEYIVFEEQVNEEPQFRGSGSERHAGYQAVEEQGRQKDEDLEEFFAAYPAFSHNLRRPCIKEFRKMCTFFKWDPMDEHDRLARQAYHRFNGALIVEFNKLFGTDPEDKNVWDRICRVLDIPTPRTIKECRKVIAQAHINIIDLIESERIGKPLRVPMYRTTKEMRQYVRESGKRFPRARVETDSVLGVMFEDMNKSLSERPAGVEERKKVMIEENRKKKNASVTTIVNAAPDWQIRRLKTQVTLPSKNSGKGKGGAKGNKSKGGWKGKSKSTGRKDSAVTQDKGKSGTGGGTRSKSSTNQQKVK